MSAFTRNLFVAVFVLLAFLAAPAFARGGGNNHANASPPPVQHGGNAHGNVNHQPSDFHGSHNSPRPDHFGHQGFHYDPFWHEPFRRDPFLFVIPNPFGCPWEPEWQNPLMPWQYQPLPVPIVVPQTPMLFEDLVPPARCTALKLIHIPWEVANGQFMVPLRKTFGAMGATVVWDADNLEGVVALDGHTVDIVARANTMVILDNGRTVATECPISPLMVNGELFVPLQPVANALGMSVHRILDADLIDVGERFCLCRQGGN